VCVRVCFALICRNFLGLSGAEEKGFLEKEEGEEQQQQSQEEEEEEQQQQQQQQQQAILEICSEDSSDREWLEGNRTGVVL